MSLRSLASWYWFLLRFYLGAQYAYEWAMRSVCLLVGHRWEQAWEWTGENLCTPEGWQPRAKRVCRRCGRRG